MKNYGQKFCPLLEFTLWLRGQRINELKCKEIYHSYTMINAKRETEVYQDGRVAEYVWNE